MLLVCTGAKQECAVKACHNLYSDDFCNGTYAELKSFTTATTVALQHSAIARKQHPTNFY